MARVNRDAAAQVIEVLDVRPDDKVLEVGFGPGVAVQLLLRRVPAGSVSNVDLSQEMVRQARVAIDATAQRGHRMKKLGKTGTLLHDSGEGTDDNSGVA